MGLVSQAVAAVKDDPDICCFGDRGIMVDHTHPGYY